MITQDLVNVTDRGINYTVGELKTQHKDLTFLREGALICLFDGLDTLLDYVSTKMPTAKEEKSSSDRGGGGGFHAFTDYKFTMNVFRNKPQSVVNFDPSELRIKDDNESGTQVDYNVTGDYIDMGRFMEGVPESVGTMHNGNARNRRVNIVVDLNQYSGLDHEDITHRSERILRLVDALEGGGVRTQLTCIDSNQCGHTEIILKRHEEPLTISDLAVVTHPEFKRRIIFRINEYSKSWQMGYGSAMIFGERLTPELIDSDNNDEMNLVIGSNLEGKSHIDSLFDQVERLIVWEMSKPVPEVSAVKVSSSGIFFNPNGSRPDDEIRREGLEAIHAE